MGCRHQAFLIARIVPHGSTDGKAYYRCIGAYHHHWCSQTQPHSVLNNFLTLLKQPVNAAIVREEVKSVQGKYGRYGSQEPIIPNAPCPYSLFLLGTEYCIDFEEQRYTNRPFEGSLLESCMGCWKGDNDDGITIIDITNPLNPSYAFLKNETTEPLNSRKYWDTY
ncbi:hypothetical protein BT96DRAFT_749889, partial [Gymnopus androsaceus JB14]